MSRKPVLLVGNGPMAAEYAKIFREALNAPFAVAGRNFDRIAAFAKQEGAVEALALGDAPKQSKNFEYVVLCTSADSLEGVAESFLKSGAPRILIEKPVALRTSGVARLERLAREANAAVRVALNRRYYPSVRALQKILTESPATSAFFDFTEIGARVLASDLTAASRARWGLVNSLHVIDTVSFLLGSFSDLRAEVGGAQQLEWHPSGGVYTGTARCGSTPVVYSSNWLAPGRWNIEVMTARGRYKLSPMEKLQIMLPGRFDYEEVPLPSEPFKPGLLPLVQAYESGIHDLPDLSQAAKILEIVSNFFGYSE